MVEQVEELTTNLQAGAVPGLDGASDRGVHIKQAGADHSVPSYVPKRECRWQEECGGVEPARCGALAGIQSVGRPRSGIGADEDAAGAASDSSRVAVHVNGEGK